MCYNGCMKEGNRNKPRALLVFGAPCSGKTTFGEKFAKKFNLAYYDFGEIMTENGFSEETMLVILSLILRTRQTIIVEGGLETERQRAEMRNLLRSHGYEPALIWIQTDTATIRNRMKSRYRSVSKAKQYYEEAISAIEAPTDIEHPIILSGKHTFETQTKHVVSGLAEAIEAK